MRGWIIRNQRDSVPILRRFMLGNMLEMVVARVPETLLERVACSVSGPHLRLRQQGPKPAAKSVFILASSVSLNSDGSGP